MIIFKFKTPVFFAFCLVFLFIISCKKESNHDQKELNDTQQNISKKENSNELLLDILQNEEYFLQVASIGSERASNEELKNFSEVAKQKHAENFEKIKLIYEANGTKIPEKLPKEYIGKLYKLTITNASDFDKYFYNNFSEDYKVKLDSTAKLINENKMIEYQDILLQISNGYNSNIESLNIIKL